MREKKKLYRLVSRMKNNATIHIIFKHGLVSVSFSFQVSVGSIVAL